MYDTHGLTTNQRGYTSKWRRAAKRFLEKNPWCVMCLEQGPPTDLALAEVCDHKIPHRTTEAIESGDPEQIKAAKKLFWDRKNWQPLCKLHHDATKQRMEKTGLILGLDANDMPRDPNHHWHST